MDEKKEPLFQYLLEKGGSVFFGSHCQSRVGFQIGLGIKNKFIKT